MQYSTILRKKQSLRSPEEKNGSAILAGCSDRSRIDNVFWQKVLSFRSIEKEKPLHCNGFSDFGIIPTLALVLDFSLKNTLFNMVLFVKIPVIRVIRIVRKPFVAKM